LEEPLHKRGSVLIGANKKIIIVHSLLMLLFHTTISLRRFLYAFICSYWLVHLLCSTLSCLPPGVLRTYRLVNE